MPPRSLTATLFGADAALWWLLIGVLLTLVAPGGTAPGAGFWLGTGLATAAGAGWGAALGPPLARRRPARGGTAGLLRFAAAGAGVLLLAGGTALLAGLALLALFRGAGATWGAVRLAFAHPAGLALPVAGLLLIGGPLGAAAGVVLHAMTTPRNDAPPPGDGSRRPPPR